MTVNASELGAVLRYSRKSKAINLPRIAPLNRAKLMLDAGKFERSRTFEQVGSEALDRKG